MGRVHIVGHADLQQVFCCHAAWVVSEGRVGRAHIVSEGRVGRAHIVSEGRVGIG